MARIDIEAVPTSAGEATRPLTTHNCRTHAPATGDAAGLQDFGVNLLHLPPRSASSQRHWHSDEDEFVWVVSGEVSLIDDSGETTLRAGDAQLPQGQGQRPPVAQPTRADGRMN